MFLTCPELESLGIDHGFGLGSSWDAQVPDLVVATQVHGREVREVPPARAETRADGLWTREPGRAVGVRTADCVPILVVDPGLRGVAAIHAGWRGSAAGIAEIGVRALAQSLDLPSERLLAAIGPHIGPCCYEVDDPVREAVAEENCFSPAARAGHYQLDLHALNRQQLLRAGLRPERILSVGACTHCHPELYTSYRRDGAGRHMLHYARLPVS